MIFQSSKNATWITVENKIHVAFFKTISKRALAGTISKRHFYSEPHILSLITQLYLNYIVRPPYGFSHQLQNKISKFKSNSWYDIWSYSVVGILIISNSHEKFRKNVDLLYDILCIMKISKINWWKFYLKLQVRKKVLHITKLLLLPSKRVCNRIRRRAQHIPKEEKFHGEGYLRWNQQ